MRENIKNEARLQHIVEAIDNIFEFVDGRAFDDYHSDKILKFAVIKNLEIVGEAAYLLTTEFKKNNPQIDWQTIIAMRHVLVHGYYQIKDEIVWGTITDDLKPLREEILKIKLSNL